METNPPQAPTEEMNTATHYDVVIIGAGMSGLAAGIRLAHFGKRVCIFERHNAVGGLNGFYSIGGRKFDVGLHAMTNFVRPGIKGTPLTKLLRQLRIDRAELDLCEQKRSRVAFGPNGEISLTFTNDFSVLEDSVATRFPAQADGFRRLAAHIRSYDEVSLDAVHEPARQVVARYISDPLLESMLFCPVMYYGSAQEHDMEFGQFAIMFKALFLEGLARPYEGVRVLLRVLVEKYRAAGGERRMKCGVHRILVRDGRAAGVVLESGEEVTADHVISSVGALETKDLIAPASSVADDRAELHAGKDRRLSFIETITVLNQQPAELGWGDDTIVFFNDSGQFTYAQPESEVDVRSGVICLPNNFHFGDRRLPDGLLRVTCLANYDRWLERIGDSYELRKQHWYSAVLQSAQRFLPPRAGANLESLTVTTDMFTPLTVTRYTGHVRGAIYGAPVKNRSGRTQLDRLYLCGTDQGFLGIIGAMLSGISMANLHILQKDAGGGGSA